MHLAEALVALALLAPVLAGTLTALESGRRAYALGAARAESQQAARVAVERLAREVRGAGAGPRPLAAISVAERERIVLHRDLDGDGVAAGRGETITWRLAGTVLRRDAGGGAQPVAPGVARFALEYLDAAGRPARAPGEVRTVVIALTTEAVRGGDRAGATFVTGVRLRNR
ncbi:MAG TPA: hypothetical protein DDZ42_04125 [Candidatus Rokubacteria bacterium]|nr:MAG: hypothetical protein A2050_00820 [Candidatus Rokubacteria bacterium GWA2_73_35]HBH01103.1 hypothetical protein [Candidatus Rokubacteria bacterium]